MSMCYSIYADVCKKKSVHMQGYANDMLPSLTDTLEGPAVH